MSNDDVKKYFSVQMNLHDEQIGSSDVALVLASDHERIVAELRAEVTKQTEWKEAFMSLAEGEVPLNERWKQECIYRDQTIAKQAKVIEKLTEQRNRAADRHHGQSLAKYEEKIKKFEAEIAAIERGEE